MTITADAYHRALIQLLRDFEQFWIATGRGDEHEALAAFRAAEDAKYDRRDAAA